MKVKKICILLLTPFFIFFSCEKEGDEDQFGQTIILKIEDHAEISEDLKVTFKDLLEDSRCPEGVECVWEGQAKVTLSIAEEDNPVSDLELILRAGKAELAKDTLHEYIYTLLEVRPYPKDGTIFEKEEYEIEIKVEEF